jgi:hypothetical protein
MKILVLGLGPTSKFRPKDYDLCIGVNDAWSIQKTDYLVTLDPPYKFPPKRLEHIRKSTCPLHTIDRFESWHNYHENVKIHPLRFWQPEMRVDGKTMFCNKSTTFAAMTLAYNLGASKIIIAGADYYKHPILGQQRILSNIKEGYKTYADKIDAEVFCTHKSSMLGELFPVYTHK